MMTRRQALKTTALAAAAAATAPRAFAQPKTVTASATAVTQVTDGPFKLPPLPYALDALEPHIDAQTMEIHHGRHHKAYVDNLNKAIADWPTMFASEKYIEALVADWPAAPEKIRDAIRNNAGGHYNHSLFWQMMKKNGGGEPKAELAKAIDAAFGSFSAFKDNYTKAALNRFGSGWAWLTLNKGKLEIGSTGSQNNPIMGQASFGCEGKPLLGLDVWEHAYYLKYQNKRADYIAAWWNVVNWDFVADRYAKAKP